MSSVVVTGLDRLLRGFREARKRLGDLSPVYKRTVGPKLREHIVRQFRSRGAAGGSPWPGDARLISQGGGRLSRSFTDRSATEHVEEYKRHTMEIGSKHPLARIHQRSRGGRRVTKGRRGRFKRAYRGVLPQRQPIAMSASQEFKLVWQPTVKYILKGFDA
jgi:hypothetical protein